VHVIPGAARDTLPHSERPVKNTLYLPQYKFPGIPPYGRNDSEVQRVYTSTAKNIRKNKAHNKFVMYYMDFASIILLG
jgi:hypothetical protein